MKRTLPALAVWLCMIGAAAAAFQPDASRRLVDLPPRTVGPVPVSIDFFLLDVDDIDGSNETFAATLYLSMKWTDPRLAFDPAEFGSDRVIYPGPAAAEQLGQIWSPAVDVENLVGAPETLDECLTIMADGTVEYERRLSGVFSSEMELSRYPFDRQVLQVRLESFMWNSSDLQLVVNDGSSSGQPSNVSESLNIRGWNMVSFGVEVNSHLYPTGDSYSRFVSHMVVDRDPWFCIWAVILPLVLVTFFALTCFFWDQEVLSERIALALYAMLTVTAQSLVVADELPKISYFTRVDYAFFLTYAVLLAVTVESLIAKSVNERDRLLADRIDANSARVVATIYVVGMAVIFFVL